MRGGGLEVEGDAGAGLLVHALFPRGLGAAFGGCRVAVVGHACLRGARLGAVAEGVERGVLGEDAGLVEAEAFVVDEVDAAEFGSELELDGGAIERDVEGLVEVARVEVVAEGELEAAAVGAVVLEERVLLDVEVDLCFWRGSCWGL